MTTAGAPQPSTPGGPAPTGTSAAPERVRIPNPTAPPAPTTRTARIPSPARPADPPPTSYLVVSGHALVVGKQPDGDSVRFRPQSPDILRELANGDRIEPGTDGSVQLRLDGIDAPELHYAGHGQPFADRSRDVFLRLLGFTEVAYAANHMTVTAATPATIPAVIVARMAEAHGRPVAYLFTGNAADELRAHDGKRIDVDAARLAPSANLQLLASGDVYPLLYTSTAPDLRAAVIAAASQARGAKLGVYAADATARFSVVDHQSVGPGGDLIFPKIFRRVTDWLRETKDETKREAQSANGSENQNRIGDTNSRASAARTKLPAWLRADPDRNDRVHVADAKRTRSLHTLLKQSGNTVTMEVDPLSLVFVER
ncbi:hypothetical protein [Yinghuangia sp. YIM S10712]|uniref:hypothetical protein n=1 Tax=Yinghuangia sp. YIM S10712 TaxID=3436930 RepID=UPI003F537FD1